MRFIPTHDETKGQPGITTGLKLVGHVSLACATTSLYARGGLATSHQTASRSAENIPEMDWVSHPSEYGNFATGGHETRRREYMTNKVHALSSTFLPDTTQPLLPPALSKTRNRSKHKRCLSLSVPDLHTIWPSEKIRQLSVTEIRWYDHESGGDSFLLLRLSSHSHDSTQWLRFERHVQDSGLKAAAALIKPLAHILVEDSVLLSSNLDYILTADESKSRPREVITKPIPFTFVLDTIDVVHKNCPTHSVASMSTNRLFLSIIMNAIHQFNSPSDVSPDKLLAQSNHPHRILAPLAQRKACSLIAQTIEIQDGWETL